MSTYTFFGEIDFDEINCRYKVIADNRLFSSLFVNKILSCL